MPKKIESMDELRPNLFDAVKRAFIFKRGVVHRPKPAAAAEPEEPGPPRRSGQAKNGAEKQDETYSEKVSEGSSDKSIETADDDKQPDTGKLKSEIEGSKTAKGPDKLEELAEKSQDVLYQAETVWPFTLFPDTIKLDREKLTIANRHFWRAATITSVPVGEIMSAEATVGPFFGSLDLTFRFFANNERKIKFLTRQDAIEMQRLIHGYIIAHRRELDVSSVNKDELVALLTELGQGASD